jgi:hypothetical protein
LHRTCHPPDNPANVNCARIHANNAATINVATNRAANATAERMYSSPTAGGTYGNACEVKVRATMKADIQPISENNSYMKPRHHPTNADNTMIAMTA